MGRPGTHKIQDDELRSFAESDDMDRRETVIVEVESTPKVRPPASKDLWLDASHYRYAIEAIESDDEGQSAGSMDRLQQQFRKMDLPEEPVRLDTAQAFVLDVTPEQLRQIAEWPDVGPIRPNRTHYAIAPSSSSTDEASDAPSDEGTSGAADSADVGA
jgi:hypothetical protein